MSTGCPAALNIKGEHFACEVPLDSVVMGTHQGLAHSNRAAKAIWCGYECADDREEVESTI